MTGDQTDEIVSQVMDQLGDELAGPFAEKVAEQMGPSLEPMSPREAVDKYFDNRSFEPATRNTIKSSLCNFFLPWCEDIAGIENMNDLTGNDLADYRVWRREKASKRVDKLKPKSEETQQKIIRKFIEYCETWEVVRPNLHEYVIVPTVSKDDEVRDEVLDSDTAKYVLEWLRKYEYGDIEHVVWLLLSSCGARTGGIHSLDRTDYISNDDGAYLKFRHRPETGTALKNGEEGERNVDIPGSVSEVLDDYIEDNRISNTDEYGREPLLTTNHGRLSKSTIRNYVYAWTRPCAIGQECPYGRDPDDCDAARRNNWAFECPDSLSCHPVRKGYITAELKAGVPKEIISERCDVSESIMDKHYDHRSEEEKMEARRIAIQLAHETGSRYGD